MCEETTICIECKDTFYLVSTDTSCVDENNCPAGTVAILDNKTCSCDENCYECEGTSTNCTECYSSYLYKNICYGGCDETPTGTYDTNPVIETNTGWRCADCDSTCLTCSLSSTSCTACSEEG